MPSECSVCEAAKRCKCVRRDEKNRYKYVFVFLFCSCGPIFGAGADLLISNDCNANTDSYSNLPHSYDGPAASCASLLGDYNFLVTDYEVYTTAQAPATAAKAKHERF